MPGFTLAKRERATCRKNAEVVAGDVYSCLVGEEGSESCIYTCHARVESYAPCWPGGPVRSTRIAYCVAAPWSRRLVALALEKPLPALPLAEHEKPRTWGLELAGGLRCVKSTAKPPMFDGMPVRYGCEHDVVLLGMVMTRTEPWHAQEAYVHPYSTPYLTAGPIADVSVAWYGIPNSR
jgi:hypothetical protein